jgi:Phosphopantetheine attachment site.
MTPELQILLDYIREQLGYQGALGLDDDLLENRILDSFNIIELALFIQTRFGIELDADDLVRANLARLSSMISLIERKRSEGQEVQ